MIRGSIVFALMSSGILSAATHEEYREARDKKPIIALVQSGVARDRQQADFVDEVQAWQGGLFRGGFQTDQDLRITLTRALHDYLVSNATGPIDRDEVIERAKNLLPVDHARSSIETATLNLVVAGSPRQSILRPIEIENPALAQELNQRALFGGTPIFDVSAGININLNGNTLTLRQERRGAGIAVDEQGTVLIGLPVREGRGGMPALIEEFVKSHIGNGITFSSWVLDRIDPTQRLAHVAIAVNITDADTMGWRTQREHDASPNSMSMGSRFGGGGDRSAVVVSRPRAALRLHTVHLVEDLLVPLRGQWR